MSEQEHVENQTVNFSNTNHAPASDERLASILKQLDFSFESLDIHPGGRTLILPFGNGQVQIDVVDGRYVHLRSLYATEVPADQLPAFYEIVNQWNAANLEPTAFIAISEESDLSVRRPVGRSVAFFPAGASDFELAVFIQASLTSARDFFVKLDAIFGQTPEELGGQQA